MHFGHALERVENQFRNGQFTLHRDESINEVVSREKVPNEPGVYIVFGTDDHDWKRPLYIGKAGTLKNDGTWKGQKLRGRLKNKQHQMARRDFFITLMDTEYAEGLTFRWFVTQDQKTGTVIPALAEAELLQAYYDDCKRLPEVNECA